MTDCYLRYVDGMTIGNGSDRPSDATMLIETYLTRCIDTIVRTCPVPCAAAGGNHADITDDILRILMRREFHYQSKGRVAHLLPDIRDRIDRAVQHGRPLPLFLLYHGGYRAAAEQDGPLTFTTDATELLLLFQIARLREAVARVYPPGVAFTIVINNGVAFHTNDIPLALTLGYVDHFRGLIASLGAEATVRLLVQSELGAGEPVRDPDEDRMIDPTAHRIVERFLGRTCTIAEARHRAAVYLAAECAWAVDIGRVADAEFGLQLRQVAHPACLSFRPFPGGAIRVQNGTIGFRLRNGVPVPFLWTASTPRSDDRLTVPVRAADILSRNTRLAAAA